MMKTFRKVFLLSIIVLTLVNCKNETKEYDPEDWLNPDVPSLCDAYKDYFDYVGFAVEYGIKGWSETELAFSNVQQGLAKHANTITMGNEFKPQFIMQWWGNNPTISGTFTASNGLTINTPVLNGFGSVDAILKICKDNNLKMRGHTLAWHSQTEEAFFREDYESKKPLVSAKEMDARLEWYIKTVLEHVATWEKDNNNGKHIIWAWDVFNEVTSDNSSASAAISSNYSDWLRTSGSNWWNIYKNPDFVIHAFQYANKYAPDDVKLVYNDYGGAYGAKHQSQLRLTQLILDHQNDELPTRLDAMGLQSHYSVKVSDSTIENEIKDFINQGLNVHITELDIGTCGNYNSKTDTVNASGKQFNSLAEAYKAYFKVYINNRKTASKNGIENITIWGINDENTWLNSDDQKKWLDNCTQYPLLFTKSNDTYYTKPAFYAVIEAAK